MRFLAALGCLTILPVGSRGAVRARDLGGSWFWFPVVGLMIGVALVGVHVVTSRVLQPLAVGACVLVAWILITGAIHLDGFGDICDGLYAGHTPEERLRIMKDPHIGAMAVVGLCALLLLKFALISSLTSTVITRALLLTPCLGRYAMVLLGTTLPYARSGSGTAAAFVRDADPHALGGATVVVLLVSWCVGGIVGLGLVGASVVGSLILRVVFQRALGGVTGAALGAAGELTEILVLLGVSLATRS